MQLICNSPINTWLIILRRVLKNGEASTKCEACYTPRWNIERAMRRRNSLSAREREKNDRPDKCNKCKCASSFENSRPTLNEMGSNNRIDKRRSTLEIISALIVPPCFSSLCPLLWKKLSSSTRTVVPYKELQVSIEINHQIYVSMWFFFLSLLSIDPIYALTADSFYFCRYSQVIKTNNVDNIINWKIDFLKRKFQSLKWCNNRKERKFQRSSRCFAPTTREILYNVIRRKELYQFVISICTRQD